jgi:predicted O-linked N-acetylglucosamine transferase (SPINDLY family)
VVNASDFYPSIDSGYYDLPIQQQVFAMFTELCPPNLFEVAPHLLNPNTKLPSPKKKVGFISSLIGDDEPHGLLVLDVIRSLSKTSYFEFFIISNGPKAPSEVFYNVTNGNVFTMGFDDNVTRDLLKSLELDCLVYLEAMNDAIMYFLGYQRFANVQILAMGSPVTSGVETFDYFVSGDLLEHPFRTQMRSDHYSEQVVLFDGQAISFPSSQVHPRQDAALAAGDAHSLSKMSPLDELKMLRRRNGHVYLCFQSIFKIQPLFDHVLADILVADYQGHIVLQASRHANQTSVVAARLQTVLKEKFCGTSSFECPAMTDAYSRVHFIGRVTSDKLIDVLQQASVILHPFPFGGSKTSLDAINAAIPIVAYPQKYLRGRLEVFLRFLDLNEIDPDAGSCCIASSVSDYVAKAVRLASDESYRTRVSNAFRERRTRIFDDKFIALEWGKLLTRALGINASEEALLSQISFSRKSYQQDDYFAKKIEEEQMRWSQNAVLSAVTSPH